jgi:hypothetical protein
VGKNYVDCPSLAALSDITDCGAEALFTSDNGNIVMTFPAKNKGEVVQIN